MPGLVRKVVRQGPTMLAVDAGRIVLIFSSLLPFSKLLYRYIYLISVKAFIFC